MFAPNLFTYRRRRVFCCPSEEFFVWGEVVGMDSIDFGDETVLTDVAARKIQAS